MRSTEHLPAGTSSAWSLRSRHSSRQRSGAGDRGRWKKNYPISNHHENPKNTHNNEINNSCNSRLRAYINSRIH